jgi:hypothetical protein
MGNAGGVMMYHITEDSFNCYETNIFTDKNMYNQVLDILKRNQITSRYNTETNKDGGGYGFLRGQRFFDKAMSGALNK